MAEEEVLSKDEMDALADSVSKGEIAVGSDSLPIGEVHPYDFLQPEHILKARLPALDVINERFAKSYQTGLFTLLHKIIDITPKEVEMIKYDEYIKSLPQKMSINRVRINQLNGVALFNIDYKLVFVIVDSFFGGKGEHNESYPERDFTDLEKRVIIKILEMSFKYLSSAWSSISNLDFVYLQPENRFNITSASDPGDIIVTSQFVFMVDDEEMEFHIAIPYSLLEPLRPYLSTGVQRDYVESDESWKDKLAERVIQSDIEIECVFANTEISIIDLFNMQVGDFIPINMRDNTIVFSTDTAIFEAKMGVSKNRAAVRFLNWCNNDANNM